MVETKKPRYNPADISLVNGIYIAFFKYDSNASPLCSLASSATVSGVQTSAILAARQFVIASHLDPTPDEVASMAAEMDIGTHFRLLQDLNFFEGMVATRLRKLMFLYYLSLKHRNANILEPR